MYGVGMETCVTKQPMDIDGRSIGKGGWGQWKRRVGRKGTESKVSLKKGKRILFKSK